MPRGGDLNQYKGQRDWGSEGDARRSMYDLARDSGMGHEQADRVSRLGAIQLAEKKGESKPGSGVATTSRSSGPRFKRPFFGEFAGLLCRVNDDGSLTPVGSEKT